MEISGILHVHLLPNAKCHVVTLPWLVLKSGDGIQHGGARVVHVSLCHGVVLKPDCFSAHLPSI